MKIEETIMIEDLMEYAKRNDYFNLTTREFAELDSKVSKALEKQIPKPPDIDHCQCGEAIDGNWKYCPNCGQSLRRRPE